MDTPQHTDDRATDLWTHPSKLITLPPLDPARHTHHPASPIPTSAHSPPYLSNPHPSTLTTLPPQSQPQHTHHPTSPIPTPAHSPPQTPQSQLQHTHLNSPEPLPTYSLSVPPLEHDESEELWEGESVPGLQGLRTRGLPEPPDRRDPDVLVEENVVGVRELELVSPRRQQSGTEPRASEADRNFGARRCIQDNGKSEGVITLGDARSVFFLTSASKFNVESYGGLFDVSPENDRARHPM